MDAAVVYLEELGRGFLGGGSTDTRLSRTEAVRAAMNTIAEYERTLSKLLLDEVARMPGATVYGVTDRERLDERVPTLCFTVAGFESPAVAGGLAARDFGVRSGHMYSPRLIARLGLLPAGAVRASLVHYNTAAEIARFGAELGEVLDDLR
jgi:selenocysteine lyase/cysteine desulfurase